MPDWRPDYQPDHLYFVTTKAVDYAHIFASDVYKRILVDTLDMYRIQQRLKLFSFVVMPNHIHLIVQFDKDQSLPDFIRDYKRHTADRFTRQLKAEQNLELLNFLASKVDRIGKQKYKVWEDGFVAKDIFTQVVLEQKLDYIHENPCRQHWKLSDTARNYIWSSARFYLTDEPCLIPVDDARKL